MHGYLKCFFKAFVSTLFLLLFTLLFLYLCRIGEQKTGVPSLYAWICEQTDAMYAAVNRLIDALQLMRDFDEKEITDKLFFVPASKLLILAIR